MESAAIVRIIKEYNAFQIDPPEGISATPENEDDIYH